MPDALEMWKQFELAEAYEVVKTAIVVMEDRTYRIEVLKSYWNPKMPFTTRAWIEEDVLLTLANPPSTNPVEETIWVDYDLPWTAREDADSALAQALGFLAERATKK